MPEPTEQPKPIAPRLHLNGSSYADLMEPLNAAIVTLGKAQKAVERTYPNGRDYYPISQGATNQAMAEHAQRLTKLSDVIGELDAIREAVQAQQDERNRQKAKPDPTADYPIRYVITCIKPDVFPGGMRHMFGPAQGRCTHATEEEAQRALAVLLENDKADIGPDIQNIGHSFEVRAVKCYPGHHDPTKTVWDD
jgi:hypothetical protein